VEEKEVVGWGIIGGRRMMRRRKGYSKVTHLINLMHSAVCPGG